LKFVSERLQRVFQLSSRERLLLGQAWVLFLLADLALRILPFKTLLALLQQLRKPEGPAVVSKAMTRNSSSMEKPLCQSPRRLADWLNPDGQRKVHSLVDKVYQPNWGW
jgi:hypothetical protein